MSRLNFKSLLHVALLCCLAFSSKAGGPWTPNQGDYYIKLSEWWINFNSHYNNTGGRTTNASTSLYSTFLYSEYGISDNLAVVLNAPILVLNKRDALLATNGMDVLEPAESLSALGDIDLGMKYRINKSSASIPLALELKLGIPSGKTEAGAFNKLATGDGEFNQMLLVHAGRGFSIFGLNSYFQAYGGINNRSNGFSEELRIGAEFGLGFFEQRLWISARINAVESFKNGKRSSDEGAISLFANNTEFVSPSIELNAYLTKKIGISAAYATATSAENIAAAPTYSLGLFIDMK